MSIKLEDFNIERKNPRYVTISGNYTNIGSGDNISIMANDVLLSRGSVVNIDGEDRIIQRIEVGNKKGMYFIAFDKLNKSSKFLTPFYFRNKQEVKWDKYFVNSYIKYKGKPGIYFLFYYSYTGESTDIEYINFEKKLLQHDNFIDQYTISDSLTLFLFDIIDEYKDDIYKIINGKYSEINDEIKDKILGFHGDNEKSILYGVLYKTKDRKKELESLFNVNLDDNTEYLGLFLEDDPDIPIEYKDTMLMYKEVYGK